MGLLRRLGLARSVGDADGLYLVIVRQARQPGFYLSCGVPDTVGGRFDMLVLHAYVVLRRLKELGGADNAAFGQAIHDRMFADLDQNLREMGVGDLSVGRQVKDMAKLLYGRIAAYDSALSGPPEALADALARNVYADSADSGADRGRVGRLAGYLREAIARSHGWMPDDIRRARIDFPSPAGN